MAEREELILIRRISGYSLTEEVLEGIDNDDTEREVYEELKDTASDLLDSIIRDARKIVNGEV